ncbi:hypothetical protein HYH02_003537 [Chlamydomonas schloesseri]|uniref:Autophagy-related protein 13 N-terminal domain-containing protein n=1 Tax=Chlamydomonas schloesseri TaxID=2026947 RepID=A0A835WR05_9CHLO|nr:hypothetical protein HYH02_003537 [Chlamydomonas schloesseri]|eukprot:KAG2451758.1 hypothetical protein HYH02_003537 [Chlamydomonas schloesseri]
MADRLTIEHYVGEAFVKCGHIILGSRVLSAAGTPAQQRPARDKRAGRWFLLELDEVDRDVGREVEAWRKDISNPLVVEVYLTQQAAASVAAAAAAAGTRAGSAAGSSPDGGAGALESLAAAGTDVLLERWTLEFVRGPPLGSGSSMSGGGGGSSSGSSGTRTYLDEASVYKRLILLVRSLYSYSRILPAYKLFRAAKRNASSEQAQQPPPPIACRVARSLPRQMQVRASWGTPHVQGRV